VLFNARVAVVPPGNPDPGRPAGSPLLFRKAELNLDLAHQKQEPTGKLRRNIDMVIASSCAPKPAAS